MTSNLQAIREGNLGAITTWLDALPSGDDVNKAKYYNSSTALHLAAEYNQPAIAKLLLERGAGITTIKTTRDIVVIR